MLLKDRYIRARQRLLSDQTICAANRKLFARFLEFEEYKLKRMNGKPTLDRNSYRTLVDYTSRLRVVNRWFKNKAWEDLTREDIQKTYDDLEDGKIATAHGTPLRDKRSYYDRIIRSKPFELAGKHELVREVMQFVPGPQQQEVRFIPEAEFRRLAGVAQKAEHRLFLWLCWDIGENATSILQLQKRDCVRQMNEHTKEGEYLINLRKETLKRTRRARSELTNYRETVDFLDVHLKDLAEDDVLFAFGVGGARKLFQRAVRKTGVRCLPGGQHVTLKDLRSSMACDLLSKDWSRDEVNARLGHAPSSREIDRYINYLAIDRKKPKRKFHETQIAQLENQIAAMRDAERALSHEFQRFKAASVAGTALLKAQTRMAMLLAKRQLGKIGDVSFARMLERELQELTEKQEGLETLRRAT